MPSQNDDAEVRTYYGQPPAVDPTKLTTDAVTGAKADLRREIEALAVHTQLDHDTLKDLLSQADSSISNVIKERFNTTDVLIGSLREVTNEKFRGVSQQFTERDTRTEQAAQESRISLDAALAAAKEAVGEQNKSNAQAIDKSEIATQKRIDSVETLFRNNFDALGARFEDMKERLDRGEGATVGVADAQADRRLSTGNVVAMITAGLLSLSIIGSTLIAVLHH